MNQLEHPIPVSLRDPGSRRGEYVQWRQRLADKQEEMRSFDEPDLGPVLDPRWSPEALFKGDAESTAPADAAPADAAPVDVGCAVPPEPPDVVDLDRPLDTPTTPGEARPRAEVETLLRLFRPTAGSPSMAAGTASPAERADGRTSTRTAAFVQQRTVARELAGPEVGATPTVVRSRHTATVGEQLRALNRRRVDGELSDDEFKRQKRDLFIRSSTAARPSR